MRIQAGTDPNESREQGGICIVSLINPILYKDAKEYKYIQGPTVLGLIGDWSDGRANPTRCLEIGTVNDRGDHLIVPLDNIAGILTSHKVLKMDNLLKLN